MKHLRVPFLSINNHTPVNVLSQELDNYQRNGIETVPWFTYRYKPEVSFAIAFVKELNEDS